MSVQTALAEINRIVTADDIADLCQLVDKVVANRERISARSRQRLNGLKKKNQNVDQELDTLNRNSRDYDDQIKSLQPELAASRAGKSSAAGILQEVDQQLAAKHAEFQALKNSVGQAEDRRADQSICFQQSFGIQTRFSQQDENEVEIDIQLAHDDNDQFTIICRKDRPRKGLHLEVAGSEPPLRGFDELERAYRSQNISFMELVVRARQLYLDSQDNAQDF